MFDNGHGIAYNVPVEQMKTGPVTSRPLATRQEDTLTMVTRDFTLTPTESRALRARSEFVLADFEEWAGFQATGEGYQRVDEMTADDLALIALYNLDNGEALDTLRDRYAGNDAALYAAHPALCPECAGAGTVERRWVTGTWASWNGPQIEVDDVACPTCSAVAV